MNCDVAQFEKQFIMAAGLEGHCRLYTLRYKVITPKVENEGDILLVCDLVISLFLWKYISHTTHFSLLTDFMSG